MPDKYSLTQEEPRPKASKHGLRTVENAARIDFEGAVSNDIATLRAGAYARLSANQHNFEENFTKVYGHLSGSGFSPELRQLESEYTKVLAQDNVDALIRQYTDGELSQEEIVSKLQGLTTEDISVEDIELFLMARQAYMNGDLDPDQQDIQFEVSQAIEQGVLNAEYRHHIIHAVADAMREENKTGPVRRVWEELIRVLPTYDGITGAKISHRTGAGLIESIGIAFAPGEARARLRRELRATDTADLEGKLVTVAEAIQKSPGLMPWYTNRAIVSEWAEKVIRASAERRPDFDWDRALWNGIGVLDASILGGPIVRSATRNSAAALFARADRRKYAEFVEGWEKLLIEKQREVMKARGMEATDVAMLQMAKMNRAMVDATIPDVLAKYQQKWGDQFAGQALNEAKILGDFYDTPLTSIVTQRAEREVATSRLASYHSNKTIVGGVEDGGVTITQTFGRDAEYGFKGAKKAVEAAVDLFTREGLRNVQIMRVNPDGSFTEAFSREFMAKLGSREKITGSFPAKGEYFIQYTQRHLIDDADRILMGATTPPVPGTGLMGLGRMTMNPEQLFSREVFQSWVNRTLAEQRLKSTLGRFTEPFHRLAPFERQRVWSVVEKDAASNKVRNWFELRDAGLSMRESEAYMALTALNDTMYLINNQRKFNSLKEGGFKYLTGSSGKFQGFGTELERLPDGVGGAFDIGKGGALTRAEVSDVLKSGEAKLYRLDAPFKGPGKEGHTYNFVIAREADVTVSPLPSQVLNKTPGFYIPRMYDTPFYVTRVRAATVDGVERDIVEHIGVARTQREASEWAAELNAKKAGGGGTRYDVDARAAYSSGNERVVYENDILDRSQLIFSDRGEELLTRGGGHLLVEPYRAIQRGIELTAKGQIWDDFLKQADADFFRIFGDLVPQELSREFSRSSGTIQINAIREHLKKLQSSAVGPELERARKAYNLWDYMSTMRGMSDARASEAYRHSMYRFANAVDSALTRFIGPGVGDATARGLMRAAEFDPVSILKSTSFAMFLAGNPTRQALLQTMQFAYAASLHPQHAARALRIAPAARAAYSVFDRVDKVKHFDAIMDAAAKQSGMARKDFDAFMTGFQRSGLFEGIDSYAYLSASMYDAHIAMTRTTLGGLAQGARNAALTPLRMAKEVGFNLGEKNNLMTTFALAASKRQKELGGKTFSEFTDANWRQVASEASTLALSMHRAGSAGYQHGVLGVATQYWSIQIKGLMGMMPAALGGSKQFTAAEKRRLALIQGLMYGPYGIGLGVFAEDRLRGVMDNYGDVVDDATYRFMVDTLTTGLFEAFLNQALYMATEEEGVPAGRVTRVSESLAPGGGAPNTVIQAIENMVDGNILEVVFGASGSAGDRIYQVGSTIRQIWRQRDEEVDNVETVQRLLSVAPQVFSGFTNAQKAYYHARVGQIVASNGQVLGDSFPMTEFTRAVFGVNTRVERDYYNWIAEEMTGDTTGSLDRRNPQAGRMKALDRRIDQYWKNVNRILQARGEAGDSPEAQHARLHEALRAQSMLLRLEPEEFHYYIQNRLNEKAQQAIGTPDSVANRVASRLMSGEPISAAMERNIRTNEFFMQNPEVRDALIEIANMAIDDLHTASDTLRDVFNPDAAREMGERLGR